MIARLFNRAVAYMASLCTDGGPSVTRWMALRASEALTMCVVCMVLTLCARYWKTGATDAGLIACICTLSASLIAATSLNQNTKLTLDAKKPGDPSSISTPGGTITTGETNPK